MLAVLAGGGTGNLGRVVARRWASPSSGGALEIIQGMVGRDMSVYDELANTLGVLAGLFLWQRSIFAFCGEALLGARGQTSLAARFGGGRMFRLFCFSLALALGLVAPAFAADNTAPLAKAAHDFYTAALGLGQGGVPDAKGRARLAPYLSPALNRLLANAAAAGKAYAANIKGEAPPLLEGDLFTSMFEGASSFKIGACEVKGKSGSCAVALVYDAPDEKPQHWTDTALLVETAAGWRVDDIDYGGHWPFANTGTLKENLSYAIHNAGGDDGK